MAEAHSFENEGDFSVTENSNVPTMGGSQTDKTLCDPPRLGTRMEFRRHRDAVQPSVVRVWSFTYIFGAKTKTPVVDTVRAEVKWSGKKQTTMEILSFGDLMQMEGSEKAVTEFGPAFL